MFVCIACGGRAERIDDTVHCVNNERGVVRILPALPEQMPWE